MKNILHIAKLLDCDSSWQEIGLFAGWQMYSEWGGAKSAGVICGLGKVSGRTVMIIANDATISGVLAFLVKEVVGKIPTRS